jgi:hypothetical protein
VLTRRLRAPAGGSSGIPGIGFIVLKNLQNPRICYVLM